MSAARITRNHTGEAAGWKGTAMSRDEFRGRLVLAGEMTDTATVSRQPFNTLESYLENMFAGRTEGAPIRISVSLVDEVRLSR